MAGKTKAKAKKQTPQTQKKGPTGDTEGRKTKPIAELHGVEALMVDIPGIEEPLSPRSSIKELQQQKKDTHQLSEWLSIMKKNHSRIEAYDHGNPQSRSLLNEFEKVHNEEIAAPIVTDSPNKAKSTKIKIDLEDVQEEIEYWENAIVCYVIGANPPFPIMERFIRRIWGKLGIDKIAAIGKGLFIVRMTTMEQRDAIIAGGFQFFDRKPLVVKVWHPEMELQKEEIKKVPIWIQLPKLELKYWGEKCLFKLVSGIGIPVRLDQATKTKDRLNFARILVEVNLDQDFPKQICFENEKGVSMIQNVAYEWLPITCENCKGLGHSIEACHHKKPNVQKNWVKKKVQKAVDEDGFQVVHRGGVQDNTKTLSSVIIRNSFDALNKFGDGVVQIEDDLSLVDEMNVDKGEEEEKDKEGEPPGFDG